MNKTAILWQRVSRPRHYRHIGWITGDVYCGPCGRGSTWPCELATVRDRLISALPVRWDLASQYGSSKQDTS